MAKEPFTLASLLKLDMGVVQAQFDAHLQRVLADVKDRAGDETARKISIVCSIKPTSDSTIGVTFTLKSDVPEHKTRDYEMTIRNVGGLKLGALFNLESPDDIKQGTLDEAAMRLN